MIIYVDIDNTICQTESTNYSEAKPWPEKINIINKLFHDGHTIVYWTARGSLTGEDHYDLTEYQLKLWGAKYHRLYVNKPYYDIFIDDRTLSNVNDIDI